MAFICNHRKTAPEVLCSRLGALRRKRNKFPEKSMEAINQSQKWHDKGLHDLTVFCLRSRRTHGEPSEVRKIVRGLPFQKWETRITEGENREHGLRLPPNYMVIQLRASFLTSEVLPWNQLREHTVIIIVDGRK